jgi:uncharacterized oligopeptide transporter (OPT) family protein
MTTSFAPSPASARSGPGPLVAAIVAVAGIAGAIGLTLAGFTFVGLAIAFPVAVPIAESHGLQVSVHDVELARQFAQFAWVFAALAVASFTGAVAVLIAVLRAVSPAPRD